MDNEIKKILGEEIKNGIEFLGTLSPDSDEYSKVVGNMERLYELKIEEAKIEEDRRDKAEKRKADDHHYRFDWINLGVQASLTLVGVFAYNCWYNRGLKFEETGTVSSPMIRNLMSKMLPKK